MDRFGFEEPTDVLGEPQSIASEMGIASKDLQAGDVTVGDSFVIERIFTDADTKKGKVSVQGYFPGHESQVKQWNENTVIMATRGGQLPAKGDAPALHRPVAPAKPQPAAFTGSIADELSGAQSWDEVRSILRGKTIVFFDYETTGFPDKKTGDKSSNQPAQLGAVKVVDGQIVDRFNLFMNPEEPLGGWSRDNLKGADGTPLTDEQLATALDKGEAHRQFIEWAGQDVILAAHNAPFDLGVMNETLGKKGLEYAPTGGVIDTLKLAQTVIASKKAAAHHVNKDQIKTGDPSGPDTHRLGDLASHFGVELGDGWHTADADSEATSNVLNSLIDYAAGADGGDTSLRSVLDAGDSYQSNMAEFEARSAQFKDELANYEIQKAIAAAWNCRGGTVASIAALIAAIDDPDCNVPSIDDLIKAATPGGTDFVDPEGLHTGDSSTGDAYTLEAEEIPEMDGVEPPFIPGIEDPDDEFRPSDQQQAVVEALFTGGDIVIRAAAGAGKTSTLKILARRLQKHKPKERVAYIAFNATVAAEARESMPSNVEVRTADSISVNWTKLNFPKLHKKKGAKDTLYSPSDIATHLKVPAMTGMDNKGKPAKLPVSESVKELRKAIYQFTISADKEIGPQHFDSDAVEASDIPKLVEAAERWWADILSENGKMLFSFPHMKKMWALSNPDLSDDSGGLKTPASVIFMDEAQDINPVLGRVIAAQTAQKVYVGDENQAIYQFMGAEDELQKVTVQHDLPLTKSYRFGEVIARNANRYLRFKERFLGEKKTFAVEGAGKFPGEIVAAGSMKNAQAVLVRSNAGAFREVRTELLNDRIVGVTKGFKADLDNFIIAVDWLQAPEATRGSRPMRVPEELRGYKNWAEIVDEAAKEGDSDFSRKTRILVDDVEQLGLEELKSLASRVKVLKGKVNTKVVDDGSLPDLPDDLSPGVEGDVGRDITFSVEEDAIVLRGSTYGVKDQIKTANGGPAKYDGDRKAWIIPAKTDKARQAGLEKLQKVLAPETVAEASYVDVVVSSVHQAKGAEWDEVRMGNDFFGPRKPKKSDGGEDADWIMPTPVELNLAYVGVTRAKKTLDPGSLNWIDSWVKSDDPEIMGLVDGVVVAPEAPEAPEAPTAASEDDSSAPTTSPDVDDEVAETAETIESVGEAVEGTNDPFGPGGEAPSAEQQAKDLEDSFNELSDYADSLTDPEGENNLKTGAKNKVKKAQKDLKQLQKDLEDGSITQAEATTKLQQMIAEFPDSDSNTEEALDMWTYRQTMIDLESVLTGERYMRPTGKGLPPRDAVDSKGRPVGFSKNGKFIRLGTRVRDKWGFSGTVDSYNENDWINVNVRYDIDPRDPAKVKKGKWGPGVARVSKNSRTLTVIEPGDREPWIDNGSVPENKKPKQIEEQTRIHLDMLEKRGETAWDGSEKDRQEPGGDLPKAEAPQGATEAPEESKASKAEFIKNSDFVDVLAEYYTTAKQAFNKGTLTKKDWDRVQSYFGSDSIAVNNFLRSGKRLWLTNDKDTIENVIKSIDDIFDVAGVELPGNVIVFRGIYDADKLFPDGVKPGDVFDDLGYSSTSIKSDVARTFTNTDETATVLAITVPSGTKMLANNTAIQAGQQKKEKEILLPRGLTFKVTSVTERTKPNKAYSFLPETYREIAVEIVSTPNAKAPKAEEIPAPPPWNPDVDAPEETAPTVANAKPSVELAAAADDARVSLDAYFDESFDKDDVEQATNSFSLKKTSHGQAADAVVYRKGADGFEVLMISREYGPFRGAMALPGGFRDGEESFADTADREMAEEVGIVAADAIKRTDLGTVLDSPDWDPRFVKGMSVGAVAYEVDGDKVEVTAGDDATGAVWIPVLDLANGKYPIAFGHATWLAEAFRDNRKYNRKFEIIKQASKERNTRLIEKINAVRSDLNEPVFEQYGPKAPDWVPEGPGRWRGAALTVDSDGVTIANGTVFDDVEKLKNGSLKPPVLPFFAPMGSEDAKDGDGYYFAKSGKRYWGRWGAEGVLLRKQGAGGEVQYLLGKRADWISSGGGKWAYPGGAHGTQFNAERGGTTGRAEILEELGVELSHPLVKGRETTALTYENPIEPDWTYRTVIIDASDDNVKQVQISDNETSEVGWFTADQIKEMNSQGMLHPSLNNNIEEILKLSEKTPVEKPVRDWSGLDIEKMETLPSGLASKKGISTLDEYFEAEEAFYSLIALDREFDAGQLAAMITQSLESSNAKKSMLDRWEKDHSMSASLEDQLTDYIDSSDKIGNSPIARWFETVDSDAIDQRQLQIEAGYEKYSGLGKIIERTGRPRVIPDVEQDFTKSNFAEIPSLMAAAQAVVNKKRASGSQEVAISAMVDSGDIEDLEVRASTVVDENGERKLRLRYTLTSWAGVAFGNRVAKDPDYRRDVVKMPSSFLNSNKDIVLDSGTAVWQFDEGVSYVWDSEDLGTVEDQKRPFTITFVQASDDPNQEELYLSTSARAPNALHNQVVIDLPLDATNAEITDALGLGGVRDPRPTTQKDLEIAVENRFLSLFGKMTDATQNAESQGKRQRMLDTIKADWGVSPSDVTVSVSSTGHIEYRIPEDVAIEIEKSTGVKYMNHSIFTSAYIKDYEKQNEKKPGYIDYHSMTPRQKADVIAEGLMKLIEAGGLMSTVSRYQEGRQFFGMSSNEDMGTGGADYVFLTPADDFVGSIGTPFREEDAAIAFNARNLLQRIDIYANRDDKYGERRESQDIISNIGVYTHEFMTKHGASLDDAKHMSVSRLVRESLLKKLAQKNISKIGGRDVEEVIVETGSKRTQDIIQSNSAGKDNILLFNNYLESIDAEPVNFNEYVATIEAASTSLEGPSSSYNKKTITYYPAPEGSVVLATRHATSPNMLLKDGDMLIVRHPDGTLWQYPAISTGDYSWGSEPNVMTDSGLAATITELRLPVPDAPDWTSKQYVPLGVQKYPKETQQIAAIESIKKGLADKTISKSSAIAKLIELAGMPITLASRAAVVTALDGMKDVTDPMTSAGQQLENIPANLSSFIERMETNNYIASPAILEMTSGEDIGSTRVVYSIRKEAISNGQGGKQIAVMAMTALGGMYFPLDLKTGLIFDTEKSIGIFSSRGIEYKIRGLSPSEQHKLL
jgi:DNA polymerase III epsilon subunit-like protein/ADP-ribose pyrophosphatase YjhB (NUDIX family)/autonomous glycyl radical cofactor GrcA